MLNQSNEENTSTTPDVTTGDTTVRTRSRRSILNQSAESVLRAKTVEHTVRVRSSGLLNSNQDVSSSLNIASQQKDSGEDQSVNTMKSSSGRSAADCIRLRRVQSLERVRRPKL
jgi:PAB1-binding protein PBP1